MGVRTPNCSIERHKYGSITITLPAEALLRANQVNWDVLQAERTRPRLPVGAGRC